uniref:Uncharacterized protein n=1 Tax=Amphimedon queenslandica TaxID=400682 RepID=A0A1X7U981_AMPQE
MTCWHSNHPKNCALLEEFMNYELLVRDNIPPSVWKALVSSKESDVTHQRANVVWHYLSTLKAPGGTFVSS